MIRFVTLLLSLCFISSLSAQTAAEKRIDKSVDSLLRLMTLDEKIGQMNQYNGPWAATGPLTNDDNLLDQVKTGKVGSMLNVTGVKRTRELQELALKSRLKIPLLFGQDVIHGFRTIFPIPLGEAASWDLKAMEDGARVAASRSGHQTGIKRPDFVSLASCGRWLPRL
jgi:beta-glucosidase